MGKTSRRKGYIGEKEFRDLAKAAGFEVVWQAEDPKKPDIRFVDEDLNCEIKYRKSVPKCVYDWLEEKSADVLAMRRISRNARGKKWLVVMDADLFFHFLGELRADTDQF